MIPRTPDEQERELIADAEGFLRFEADAPGQYLLTIAHHREPVAGFHLGRPYSQTSHNCSLVWQQSEQCDRGDWDEIRNTRVACLRGRAQRLLRR
jgi:hypothetical protein